MQHEELSLFLCEQQQQQAFVAERETIIAIYDTDVDIMFSGEACD